jgi:hypothetical protein
MISKGTHGPAVPNGDPGVEERDEVSANGPSGLEWERLLKVCCIEWSEVKDRRHD